MAQTEFNDMSGKPVFTGDIVQYRLSTNAKRHGGPWIMKVTKTKRGIILNDLNEKIKNLLFRKNLEQYIAIIDTTEREK